VFVEDIETYNLQIQYILNNNTDLRMVDVLNNPPMPAPPPVENIRPDPIAPPVGNIINYIPAAVAPTAAQRQIPGYINYFLMYTQGKNYLVDGQNYSNFVFFDPPTMSDNTYQLQLRKFVRLYDQIRRLHAFNTGSDVFDMQFIAPNYSSSGSIESFVDTPATQTDVGGGAGAPISQAYKCMNINNAQEAWYVNQILDVQGKFDAQRAICETKGLDYDATKCGLTNCYMPSDSKFTTAPPEPETGRNYNFNKLTFSASGFPARLDQTNYAAKLASAETFKAADIEKYFNFLNDYNFYWLKQDGWRQVDNPKKPYNPPLPPWFDISGAGVEANLGTRYADAIAAFNNKVIQKIRAFNNYEEVNLPADFGPLPQPPPYPHALYELLTKPRLFLTPTGASNLKTSPEGAPDMKYEVPITELPLLYDAAQKRNPTPQAASKKPQCAGPPGSNVCVKYDDELSDAAKLLLQNMEAQRKLRARAMENQQPTNMENVQDKLNSYYDSIRGDIRSFVANILGRS
jgi:hypothetical protein